MTRLLFALFMGLTYCPLWSQPPQPDSLAAARKAQQLQEVVVRQRESGVRAKESPLQVETVSATFLKKNPAPNLLESLQGLQGIRAQTNCQVCQTGDIRLGGMDGPYTLITLDGMPIMSALGSVYGLSGIPASLIEQLEVTKGGVSAQYGPEAAAGVVNITTKNLSKAPRWSVQTQASHWGETQVDLGMGRQYSKAWQGLGGAALYRYQNPIDRNGDGFTDLVQAQRASVFYKIQHRWGHDRHWQSFVRGLYEDRWGGQVGWNRSLRGGDQTYAESVYTYRWEWLNQWQWGPHHLWRSSVVQHEQDAAYGQQYFWAWQQLWWTQYQYRFGGPAHQMTAGADGKWQISRDTAPVEAAVDNRMAGLFVQDQWTLSPSWQALLSVRYDYHVVHHSLGTPRLALRWKPNEHWMFKTQWGLSMRSVQVFSEDHQALSGSRKVQFAEALQPERAQQYGLSALWKRRGDWGNWTVEVQAAETRFTRKITADYDSNPQAIIYRNNTDLYRLRNLGLQLDWVSPWGITLFTNLNLYDARALLDGEVKSPLFTEKYQANWSLSYQSPKGQWRWDYNGSVLGPMRMPLQGPLDPRPEWSPAFAQHHLQCTWVARENAEWYVGIKNLFNQTPAQHLPFVLARAQDPFDHQVQYDAQGQIMPTADNPYALRFDTSYGFAPNVGLRLYLGFRWHWD